MIVVLVLFGALASFISVLAAFWFGLSIWGILGAWVLASLLVLAIFALSVSTWVDPEP
jgi:hypothetical protein